MHYARYRKWGDPLHEPMSSLRKPPSKPIDADAPIVEIPLGDGLVAHVDREDFHLVERHRWRAVLVGNTFYAFTTLHRRMAPMHRMIIGAPPRVMVDHIDGNGLNNRRGNLRLATPSIQTQNARHRAVGQSGYLGVYSPPSRHSRPRPWAAWIKCNGRVFYLGAYRTPEEAAHAYDGKARELYGPQALTNFPLDQS
jgi:hypothetical protein